MYLTHNCAAIAMSAIWTAALLAVGCAFPDLSEESLIAAEMIRRVRDGGIEAPQHQSWFDSNRELLLRPEMIPYYDRCWRTGSQDERRAVIVITGMIPGPTSARLLERMAHDSDGDLRVLALEQLEGRGGPSALRASRACADDRQGWVRAAAFRILADWGGPTDCRLIWRRRTERNGDVKLAMVAAAAAIEDRHCRDYLEYAAGDPDEHVAREAKRWLP